MLTTKLLISQERIQPHKKADQILRETTTIIEKLGMNFSDLYNGHSDMSIYLYPEASVGKLVDATVFFNILYYFDDIYGEDTKRKDFVNPTINDLTTMWKAGSIDTLENASGLKVLGLGINKLRDIINKFQPALQKRITETLFKHITHSLQPAEYATISEYISTRVEFSGMYLTIDMLEYVYDIDSNILMKGSGKLSRLKELCAQIGALSNDLFSYPKEVDSKFNLINAILKINRNYSVETAIDESVKIVNGLTMEFLSILNNNFSSISSVNLTELEYAQKLRDIVSASYTWQVSTKRYKHTDHFFEDMKE